MNFFNVPESNAKITLWDNGLNVKSITCLEDLKNKTMCMCIYIYIQSFYLSRCILGCCNICNLSVIAILRKITLLDWSVKCFTQTVYDCSLVSKRMNLLLKLMNWKNQKIESLNIKCTHYKFLKAQAEQAISNEQGSQNHNIGTAATVIPLVST